MKMTYAINSPYEEKIIHPNGITDNPAICIKVDHVTRGIDVTIHNVEGGGGMI